jgi:membrane protein YdbS with pleckstrin-like domain
MDASLQPTRPLQIRPQSAPPAEVLVGRWRRHWLVLARHLLFPIMLTLLGVVAFLIVNTALASSLTPAVPDFVSVVIIALLLFIPLVSVLWALYIFWEWQSTWIELTNQRLIVRESAPLRHETRREVPLDKVQNVISQLDNPVNKSLKFGGITIGTASFGTINFKEIRDPNGLRSLILEKQKEWQAVIQPSFETWLRSSVRDHVLYAQPLPPRPSAMTNFTAAAQEGHDTLNLLFPRHPQRTGTTVIWHKHWWFLLAAEAVPFLLLLLFEGTVLAVNVVFRLAGSDQNPMGDLLAVARPFVWLLILLAMIYQWEDWRNDYYKVQGDSLIDYEARPLGLQEETKETKLDRITDLRVDQPNPLSFVLGYGDIVIKVPGESAAFTFDGVPNPREVLNEIMERIDAQQKRKREQQYEDILKVLRLYTGEIQNYQAWRDQQQPPPPPPDLPAF